MNVRIATYLEHQAFNAGVDPVHKESVLFQTVKRDAFDHNVHPLLLYDQNSNNQTNRNGRRSFTNFSQASR